MFFFSFILYGNEYLIHTVAIKIFVTLIFSIMLPKTHCIQAKKENLKIAFNWVHVK